jgi:hypothetical protein
MKKILVIVLAVVLTLPLLLLGSSDYNSLALGSDLHEKLLTMTYYNGCGTKTYCNACGPCSGTSIGRYYREVKGYWSLPAYCETDNSCYDLMYDELYDHMNTSGSYTHPTICYGYGYGFVQMALERGYYNFRYVNDMTVTPDDYWDIVNAINNGWPVALNGNFKNVNEISGDLPGGGDWPSSYGHYIAIKGYSYQQSGSYTWNRRIVCTDSYCWANELVLDWDNLIANGLYLITITIKDEESDIEDFEWGNNGDSLAKSGGDVQWTVSTGGSSVAKIDKDYYKHPHSGTRSARIYRDGSNSVYAYYSKFQPNHIGFYLMKDGNAYADIINGDGTHRINVRINSAEMVQYYDDAGYHDTGYKIAINTWYLIELRNINWGAATYDIYVNGDPVKTGATMHTYSGNNGYIYYGSSAGSGTFSIDDILN